VRIDQLPPGEIHAIGAAGLETATMVRFLVEGGAERIVLHDEAVDLGSAFRQAHRFQPPEHVERSWRALSGGAELRQGTEYLAGLDEAAAILVPCSWMLRPDRDRLDPFADRVVRYPDACFDLFAGQVIAITGSFGKTTTSRFAATLVDGLVCGNDRAFHFDLTRLAAADAAERMVFETSNRHLADGFRRVVEVGVVTGLTRNHEPDHGSFEAYRRAKYRMAEHCKELLYHESIPRDYTDAAPLVARGTAYGPTGTWRLEDTTVVGPGGFSAAVPSASALSAPNRQNALAAAAAALLTGVDPADVTRRAAALPGTLPHYRQAVDHRGGRTIINDAASCMPAATAPLVAALDEPFVLICGGDRQRYWDGEFDVLATALVGNPWTAGVVVTAGPMTPHLAASLRAAGCPFVDADDIPHAVERALEVTGAAVVFSPACGTGTLFLDKYERGELFDAALDRLVPAGQTPR
jgi:UDP-N-acetylmuramoylalanine--D-glutamate ligase